MFNFSNIIRPEESYLRYHILCAPWCTARTVTAAGTGYFPTVEESSLKPWRVEKVVTIQYSHTQRPFHTYLAWYKHLVFSVWSKATSWVWNLPQTMVQMKLSNHRRKKKGGLGLKTFFGWFRLTNYRKFNCHHNQRKGKMSCHTTCGQKETLSLIEIWSNNVIKSQLDTACLVWTFRCEKSCCMLTFDKKCLEKLVTNIVRRKKKKSASPAVCGSVKLADVDFTLS